MTSTHTQGPECPQKAPNANNFWHRRNEKWRFDIQNNFGIGE